MHAAPATLLVLLCSTLRGFLAALSPRSFALKPKPKRKNSGLRPQPLHGTWVLLTTVHTPNPSSTQTPFHPAPPPPPLKKTHTKYEKTKQNRIRSPKTSPGIASTPTTRHGIWSHSSSASMGTGRVSSGFRMLGPSLFWSTVYGF